MTFGAAVAVLNMPVTYTGGAEVAHPHAFLQYWDDLTHGTFDHHRGHSSGYDHDSNGHDHAAGTQMKATHVPTSFSEVQISDDLAGPAITNHFVPEMRSSVLSLTEAALFDGHPRLRSHSFLIQELVGRSIAPEAPPPKSIRAHT